MQKELVKMDKKKIMSLNPIIFKIIEIKSAIEIEDFDKARKIIATIKTNKEILRYSEFLERVIAKLDELIEEK